MTPFFCRQFPVQTRVKPRQTRHKPDTSASEVPENPSMGATVDSS